MDGARATAACAPAPLLAVELLSRHAPERAGTPAYRVLDPDAVRLRAPWTLRDGAYAEVADEAEVPCRATVVPAHLAG